MSPFLFYTALLSLLILIVITIELLRGVRTLGFLEDVPPIDSPTPPLVSVVIPARNERRHLEMALQSVLGQKYPTFEVIVIDDRSTDETGEILDRMAVHNPLLRVFHIQELPQGWLGKNYALSYGASKARGDLLLFTDADVIMEPTTLSRAVSYLIQERLDHLTLSPTLSMPSLILRIFVTGFYFFFSLYARPWKARDPKSHAHIGIGAFNLIRQQVYQTIGTHQVIAMRPDDDMKLGKIVKKNGFSQGFLFGNRFISVEWYASVRELVHGMMKNSFAGVGYRISMVVAATLGQFMLFIWPFLAALSGRRSNPLGLHGHRSDPLAHPGLRRSPLPRQSLVGARTSFGQCSTSLHFLEIHDPDVVASGDFLAGDLLPSSITQSQ